MVRRVVLTRRRTLSWFGRYLGSLGFTTTHEIRAEGTFKFFFVGFKRPGGI
jgi:hypothetical protein